MCIFLAGFAVVTKLKRAIEMGYQCQDDTEPRYERLIIFMSTKVVVLVRMIVQGRIRTCQLVWLVLAQKPRLDRV